MGIGVQGVVLFWSSLEASWICRLLSGMALGCLLSARRFVAFSRETDRLLYDYYIFVMSEFERTNSLNR
jgi:hypothetical protein